MEAKVRMETLFGVRATNAVGFVWPLSVIVFWLIPLFIAGAKFSHVDGLGRAVGFQYSCAGLFTGIERSWTQAAYLVQVKDDPNWREVPREVVSPMPVAGYRQRVDRVVSDTRRSVCKDAILDRLATHIAEQYRLAYPDQPQVESVKIINTFWKTDDPVMTHPAGHWKLPPAGTLERNRYAVLGLWKRTIEGFRRSASRKESPPRPSGPLAIRRRQVPMTGLPMPQTADLNPSLPTEHEGGSTLPNPPIRRLAGFRPEDGSNPE